MIMTGPIASRMGFPGFGVYAASKAALRSFARTWLNELKCRIIRVNVLGSGPNATPMQAGVPDQGSKGDVRIPNAARNDGRTRRDCDGALFLASDDSSFVRLNALIEIR